MSQWGQWTNNGIARRRPEAFPNNPNFRASPYSMVGQRFYVKGSAVFVAEGEFNVRNDEPNKAYFRCVFYNGSYTYCVKVYSNSDYTPSSGRHNGKTCYPVSVKCFKRSSSGSGFSAKSEKIGAKMGSGVLCEPGTFKTRNGEENKAYIGFSFYGVDRKIYKIKCYVSSVYQPGNGKHLGKDCCPLPGWYTDDT